MSQKRKVSAIQQVVLNVYGNIAYISEPDPTLITLLDKQLTYEKISFVYARRGSGQSPGPKSNVQVEEICCGAVIENFRGKKDQYVFGAGYVEDVKKLLSQLGYQVKLLNTLKDPKREERLKPDWSYLDDVKFRWMQREILEYIFNNHHTAINAPTGIGKGFLITCLARALRRANILITTPSATICEQIYAELSLHLSNVGIWHAQRKAPRKRVMVVTAKSLHRVDWQPDVVICDEVHEFGTADNLSRIAQFRTAKVVGLSASWGERTDSSDFELRGYFGPLAFDLPYQDCVKHGLIVPIRVVMHRYAVPKNPVEGLTQPTAKNRAGIWRNRKRNELVRDIARLYPSNVQVLILVSRLDHLIRLKALLPEFEVVYGMSGADKSDTSHLKKYYEMKILKKMSPKRLIEHQKRVKRRFEKGKIKKVIATGIWKRGVNFKDLAVLIWPEGSGSKIDQTQAPGRPARLGSKGKKVKAYATVHDFCDTWDKSFERKTDGRVSHYRKKKWDVIFVQGARLPALTNTKHQQRELPYD